MVYDYFDKFTFLCEMYDEGSDSMHKLILNFFPFDNSLQVIDTARGRSLLRRTQIPTVKLESLKTGNIVNIFSKLLHITDCAPSTKKLLFDKSESAFALIKPMPPELHGKIITFIVKNGFSISRMKNGKICKEFAMRMYEKLAGSSLMPLVVDYITSGEVIGLELVAPDAVSKWQKCLGDMDPGQAACGTLRKLYGKSIIKNVAHGCDTPEHATQMLNHFFGHREGHPVISFRTTYKNCTCCLIKPHAVSEDNVGPILEKITRSGKFYIAAMAMFSVKIANAHEFYEVYKGVLPEYESMCVHLAEGKCVVLEVKGKDPEINVVCEFRKFCGSRDPEVCRQLYPDTIRAEYGKDIVHNAVHCTDLPEDGVLEVEYFFKLVANDG